MVKTIGQLLIQTRAGEQRLEQQQPGERGQFLVFKMKPGNVVRFTVNSGFAIFRADGLLRFYRLVCTSNVTKAGPFFIAVGEDLLRIFRSF